jgi:hypothetical protein
MAEARVRIGAAEMRFTACGECGAVTGVEAGGQAIFGEGAAGHQEWHKRLQVAVLNARLSLPMGDLSI